MYVIDYNHVLCFGPIEYQILLKLLNGRNDLTDSEEGRAEQMYRTLISMKKAKESRQEGYTRPVRTRKSPIVVMRKSSQPWRKRLICVLP